MVFTKELTISLKILGVYDKALTNAKKQDTTHCSGLGHAFVWAETPEGSRFWYKKNKLIQQMEIDGVSITNVIGGKML